MTEKKINIAIDGHSSCGKSTLAKHLAMRLNYIYIDSGAMYRAVALFFLENKVDRTSESAVTEALDKIHLDIAYPHGKFAIFLNQKDITSRIIQLDVSSIVSEVAALSVVRRKLVLLQQELGKKKGVVMDGRDIGTVVFPEAELKLFVTANIETRSNRRFLELKGKNLASNLEEVTRNLQHRDHIDSTREDSPLIQAEDAILIDNTYMDREEQLLLALRLVEDQR